MQPGRRGKIIKTFMAESRGGVRGTCQPEVEERAGELSKDAGKAPAMVSKMRTPHELPPMKSLSPEELPIHCISHASPCSHRGIWRNTHPQDVCAICALRSCTPRDGWRVYAAHLCTMAGFRLCRYTKARAMSCQVGGGRMWCSSWEQGNCGDVQQQAACPHCTP